VGFFKEKEAILNDMFIDLCL